MSDEKGKIVIVGHDTGRELRKVVTQAEGIGHVIVVGDPSRPSMPNIDDLDLELKPETLTHNRGPRDRWNKLKS